MQKTILIPAIISSSRIAVLPLFFYFYNPANIAPCLVLLAFSASTDFFDGYVARKLGAASRFGAYYDATTDFVLVIGVFLFFTADGFYPIWLPLLIAISFVQFIVTSYYVKKVYDPIGKYIGSALYIGIVLTLVFPTQATYTFVQYAFVGFFLVSLGSRIANLARKRDSKLN
ncbi:MAG: CDP-alcohol phosphatidyltransferase family protein [Candidatus Bathyarchaeia archaeon]